MVVFVTQFGNRYLVTGNHNHSHMMIDNIDTNEPNKPSRKKPAGTGVEHHPVLAVLQIPPV